MRFLGRLHPKKGLVNTLRAWSKIRGQGSGVRSQESGVLRGSLTHIKNQKSKINNLSVEALAKSDQQSTIGNQGSGVRGQEEWQFVIAGWDQGGHEAELKCLCTELGLAWADASNVEGIRDQVARVRGQKDATAQRYSSSLSPDPCPLTPVVFLGPAFGEAKDQLLRRAHAFILPSFSEGLPMSVLEAWAYQLPVLMTDACNLPEGFAADAAIRIGTGIRGQGSGDRSQEIGRSCWESTRACGR